MSFLRLLQQFVFPHRCLSCLAYRAPDDFHPVCALCSPAVVEWPVESCTCCGCYLPMPEGSKCGPCLLRPGPIDHTQTAFLYGGAIRDALLNWKTRESGGWGTRELVALLETDSGNFPSREFEWWVPIPPSPRNQRHRNFDPTLTLSRLLASAAAAPPVVDLLRETGTRTTTGKRRYALKRKGPLPKRILLLDDIRTTGNAASSAAAVLKACGVQRVGLWTYARASNGVLPEIAFQGTRRG